MNIEKAEGIVDQLNKQVAEQEKAMSAYSQMINNLYDPKKGVIAGVNNTLEKIDTVDAPYAMQLAVALKNTLKKTIPGLYEKAKKFVPKRVRKALKTIIKDRVEDTAELAKDAYNQRAKSKKFHMEASAAIKQYQMVAGGI